MFDRVLVANRGEIAVRIIRACRELGIHSVAVYSEADENSLHVQLANEAICIGPAASSESYLKFANIISAAAVANVDAEILVLHFELGEIVFLHQTEYLLYLI